MPEGPEIRRAAQAVHRGIAGQPVRMTLAHPALAPMERALRGASVESVSARSKAMLTRFSTGDVLYSHNQLYGEWVVDRPDEPLRTRAIRLVLETSAQRAVLYSATDFAWLRHGKEAVHPYIAKLGPEVLDDATTARDIAVRLAQFPRRPGAATRRARRCRAASAGKGRTRHHPPKFPHRWRVRAHGAVPSATSTGRQLRGRALLRVRPCPAALP